MLCKVNNINFTSNIRFCTPEEYEANKPLEYGKYYPEKWGRFFRKQSKYQKLHPKEASYPWNIKSIERKSNIITGKIYICDAGAFTVDRLNSQVNRLNDKVNPVRFHFVPEEANIKGLRKGQILNKALKRRISKFNDYELSVFVTGGDATSPEFHKISRRLFKEFIKFLSKLHKKINISYFWGQDTAHDRRGMDAYYKSDNDTWYILKFKKNSNDVINSVQDVVDNFVEFYLSKKDKLFFSSSKEGLTKSDFLKELRKINIIVWIKCSLQDFNVINKLGWS